MPEAEPDQQMRTVVIAHQGFTPQQISSRLRAAFLFLKTGNHMEKEPGVLAWLASLGSWALGHPYLSWGGGTAFLAALWSSLRDGRGWCSSIFGSVLAALITLSLLAVMRKTGLHEEWMPLVGLLVGCVGADRIRAAVLAAWDSRKQHLKNFDNRSSDGRSE